MSYRGGGYVIVCSTQEEDHHHQRIDESFHRARVFAGANSFSCAAVAKDLRISRRSRVLRALLNYP